MNDDALFNVDPYGEIYFSDIEPSETIEYAILILDINDYNIKTVSQNRKYISFKCKVISGFPNKNHECVFLFHFPLTSFKANLYTTRGYTKVSPGEVKDVVIKFKRYSKKKLVFTEMQYLDPKKYNVEEYIKYVQKQGGIQ